MLKQFTPQSKAIALITEDESGPTTVMIRTEDGRVVWLTTDKAVDLANKILAATGQAVPASLPGSRLVQ